MLAAVALFALWRSLADPSATRTPPPAESVPVPPSASASASSATTPSASLSATEGSRPSAPATLEADPVLIAAGDIADCASSGDEETAALLDQIPGTVAALGDLAYPSGTTEEFANCYGPSWGRDVARTRPAPGNHEYETPGAAPYFAFFGPVAGVAGQGWYSYDLGAWHVVALNSVCDAVGGCHAGSPQEQWLVADLAAHPADCTLAYWHHPFFSSAQHGSHSAYDAFWRALHAAGADLVLVGHDHVYERFAPQAPDATGDPQAGIRQFTVGTGGRSHYRFDGALPNSEVRNNDAFGVLVLTLREESYAWEFVPAAGANFTDAGSAACH